MDRIVHTAHRRMHRRLRRQLTACATKALTRVAKGLKIQKKAPAAPIAAVSISKSHSLQEVEP